MPFDLVVPVWWGSHPAWGVRLLESLTFEAIRMALETGSLPDDVRLTFNAERAAEQAAGTLWLLEQTSPSLLLHEAHDGLPGKPFALEGESLFAASNLTFAGDQPRLLGEQSDQGQEHGPAARRWSHGAGQ